MITKENIEELDKAVKVICKYCSGWNCSKCSNRSLLYAMTEKYEEKYLLCELDDENYAYPAFLQFDNFEDAYKKALLDCGSCFNEGKIKIDYDDKRISVQSDDRFFVTEIKSFNPLKGNHMLVWHHAYNGVGFSILAIGTYAECLERRKEEVKKYLMNMTYQGLIMKILIRKQIHVLILAMNGRCLILSRLNRKRCNNV